MSEPRISLSVIVPMYNATRVIERCLTPLRRMLEHGEILELLVVDDRSTDGCPAMVARMPGVVLLSREQQGGPGAARNTAAVVARGTHLWFVDSDVVVAEDAARVLARTLAETGATAVHGSYDDRPAASNFLSQYKNLVHHYYHQRGKRAASTFWAGCGAVDRETFLRLGGFDAIRYRYPSIEDIDLGYRIRAAGGTLLMEPKLQGKHLKEWRTVNLIHTEIFRRALPWSRLMLERKDLTDDLNVGKAERLRALLAGVTVAGLAAAAVGLLLPWVAGLALLICLAANLGFVGFFVRRRGVLFAARAFLFHQLYYLYSSAAFATALTGRTLQRLGGRAAVLVCAVVIGSLLGCSAPPEPPEVSLQRAQSLFDAGDARGAQRLLQQALAAAPRDARIERALGRAELAVGEATAAEGSLRHAMELGAPAAEVVPDLARALLTEGDPYRAIALIGDLEHWPRELQPSLALTRAEAELATPNYDVRALTQQFTSVFRLLAAPISSVPAVHDRARIEARLQQLRQREVVVQSAYEHFSCAAEMGASSVTVPAQSPPDSGRRTLRVGPNTELRRPGDAARIARDGDVIEIEAGTYAQEETVWTQSGLLLRGVHGRARLDHSGRTLAGGGIWEFSGNDIVVENVEFSGARSADRNGAGIKFHGRSLTVRDSSFHDNENGLLTWNDPASEILVERSVFAHNGFGDGKSHNIYVGRVGRFTLRFSFSHDAHKGHEVKSRAQNTFILYNRLTDEDDGDSAYLIDVPEGGYAYIIGNVLEKGARADNPSAIAFGAENPSAARGGLWIVNNSFYNRLLDATFAANRTHLPAWLMNNVLAGAPFDLLEGAGQEHHNFRQAQPTMVNAAAYDFRPTADSPLIDSGADPGSTPDARLVPEFQYVHPARGVRRPKVGPLDIGAYEFCGW
jgi:glycosyltransferase involved in cell wall biosynthesis